MLGALLCAAQYNTTASRVIPVEKHTRKPKTMPPTLDDVEMGRGQVARALAVGVAPFLFAVLHLTAAGTSLALLRSNLQQRDRLVSR